MTIGLENQFSVFLRVAFLHRFYCIDFKLRPSINRLVSDRNTKLTNVVEALVLVLFQSTTDYKMDSEHTQDYTKLFRVCKVEILQVTVNKVEVLSSF